jgi:hypothetical protein
VNTSRLKKVRDINSLPLQQWWSAWNFRDNPLKNRPLEADEIGLRLLVGRDNEVGEVCSRLLQPEKICCVEGHIGVGKTSLVNTAAYYLYSNYKKTKKGQLLIPCDRIFQLSDDETIASFTQKVYLALAQTLIKTSRDMAGLAPDMDEIQRTDTYLNSGGSTGGSVNVMGFGGGVSTNFNTSSTFQIEGIPQVVKKWLRSIFPQPTSGAVVCIIDNLELLQSSASARNLLESLRDDVFTMHGVQWVVCGANGIVNSVVASPRITGYLAKPIIEVGTLPSACLPELLDTRIAEYRIENSRDFFLPFTSKSFQDLYDVLGFNLRDTLSYAEDYCAYVYRQDSSITAGSSTIERETAFEKWVRSASERVHDDVAKGMTAIAWSLLDTAMSDECRGAFGVGDYKTFWRNCKTNDFPKEADFRKLLKRLTTKGLISVKFVDEDDDGNTEGRTLYSVTSKAAFAHFHRLKTQQSETLADTSWLKRTSGLYG